MYTVVFGIAALAVNFVLLSDNVIYVSTVDGVTQRCVAFHV